MATRLYDTGCGFRHLDNSLSIMGGMFSGGIDHKVHTNKLFFIIYCIASQFHSPTVQWKPYGLFADGVKIKYVSIRCHSFREYSMSGVTCFVVEATGCHRLFYVFP